VVFIPSIEEISKGVKVVALTRRFLRSASVVLLIGRGSYEDAVEGCACLTNRMRLRLTSKLHPLQLQTAMDRLGATVDATTDRDLMLLRTQVPRKRVKESLKFLTELFMSPSFPAPEVAKEKASQKLEYEKIRQDPRLASISDAWEATFPKNPLAHPVTGYPSTIENLTPKILEEFDTDTRKKAPLVIGIVGPQAESELIHYSDSAFEKIKATPRVQKFKLGPKRDFNILSRRLKVKQTTFSVGIVTEGVSSSEYPALLLINDHLGSDRHYFGVLSEELREKRGLTYFASSRLSALRDCGLLTAYAGVKHEEVSDALRLMLRTIVELREKPLPEKKLEQLKIFHRQVMETTLEAPYQAATWLATEAFRGGKVDFETYVSDINAASSETVRKIANKLLTPSRLALSVAGRPPPDQKLRNIMKEEIA
jgi:zinc protease